MADIEWTLPKPIDGGAWLANPSESGGIATNGAEQTLISMAMYVKCRLIVAIRTTEEVLEARAFFAEAAGKAGNILVPFFDGKRANWPVDQWGRVAKPSLTRIPSLDGTEFESDEIPVDSDIIASLVGDMDLRATSCSINVSQGEPIRAGQWFSLGGRRAYLVRTAGAPSSGTQAITFYPPARRAANNADPVELARPVCVMNQLGDDQGIQELTNLTQTILTLDFREAIAADSGSGT